MNSDGGGVAVPRAGDIPRDARVVRGVRHPRGHEDEMTLARDDEVLVLRGVDLAPVLLPIYRRRWPPFRRMTAHLDLAPTGHLL